MKYLTFFLSILIFFSCTEYKETKTNCPTCPTCPAGNIPSGFVANFPFDGNANDVGPNKLVPNKNTAELSKDRKGYKDSCYYFDGTTFIDYTNPEKIFKTSNYTIAFWLKTDLLNCLPFSTHIDIISICDTIYSYFAIAVTTTLGLEVWTRFNDKLTFLGLENKLYDKKWYHIAVTFALEQGNIGIIKFYIDGKLEAQGEVTKMLFPQGCKLRIGGRINQPSMFSGWIDDLLIYDRELSEYEINRLIR